MKKIYWNPAEIIVNFMLFRVMMHEIVGNY